MVILDPSKAEPFEDGCSGQFCILYGRFDCNGCPELSHSRKWNFWGGFDEFDYCAWDDAESENRIDDIERMMEYSNA